MVNAGISNIGVATSLNMRALVQHLGSGEAWGLDKKRDGLFLLPTASDINQDIKRRLDLKDIYVNVDYLNKSSQEYILISGSNIVCNIDFNQVLTFHLENKADITVVCTADYRLIDDDIFYGVYLKKLKSGRISSMSIGKPQKNTTVSMDMYLMKKSLLLDILNECLKNQKWDFISDILPAKLKELKVFGYVHEGYLAIINSWQSLYKHQMDLLNPQVLEELFISKGTIYTKRKDGPPTRYIEGAVVSNVLAANECYIEGKVENSILSRKVKVGRGAVIKNSILLSKVEVEEDAILDKVFLDKAVHVHQGAILTGLGEPLIIEKNREVGGGV
jgi:glucose-1-phosphate adenylyltransferase